MGTRVDLQAILEGLLGSANVYFQPPPNVQMQYPAIVYKRDAVDSKFADNIPYRRVKRYLITVIDPDPDSEVPDKVGELPMSRFVRNFAAKNLNHDLFTLHF
jgi:hypothetical protein